MDAEDMLVDACPGGHILRTNEHVCESLLTENTSLAKGNYNFLCIIHKAIFLSYPL